MVWHASKEMVSCPSGYSCHVCRRSERHFRFQVSLEEPAERTQAARNVKADLGVRGDVVAVLVARLHEDAVQAKAKSGHAAESDTKLFSKTGIPSQEFRGGAADLYPTPVLPLRSCPYA